jgi:ABC transporter, permease protein
MEQTIDTAAMQARQSRIHARRRAVVGKVLSYTLLIVLCLFFLFPFLCMFCISILSDKEVYLQVLFSPSGTINLGTYISIFRPGSNYLHYLFNSLQVALITAIGIPFASSLCAYGFAKMDFKGRNLMFGIVLSTMMIPAVVTLIPLQSIFNALGWLNTLYPMWVPSLFGGGATNIFLMRQFMMGIPNDMLNSAKLDGANSFVIYLRIMLPLCIPIFLYVAVMAFMGSWNDFMTPMTYLGNASSPATTLALGIYYDYGPVSRSLPNAAMAAGVVMTLPCAILFFAFQRFLIDGVAITGMKG